MPDIWECVSISYIHRMQVQTSKVQVQTPQTHASLCKTIYRCIHTLYYHMLSIYFGRFLCFSRIFKYFEIFMYFHVFSNIFLYIHCVFVYCWGHFTGVHCCLMPRALKQDGCRQLPEYWGFGKTDPLAFWVVSWQDVFPI